MDNPALLALQRSTAMLSPGAATNLRREDLLEILEELITSRSLLERLGSDLKSVARRGK